MEHMQPICLQNRHKEFREWRNQPGRTEVMEDYRITFDRLLCGGPGYHAKGVEEIFIKGGKRLRDTLCRREDAREECRLRPPGGGRSVLQGGPHHRLHGGGLFLFPHRNPWPRGHGEEGGGGR